MFATPKTPPANSDDDPLDNIQYQFFFGKSWEECGVSKADGLLTALGFSTREEVAAFCLSTNVLSEFSTEGFFRPYINKEDRQILVKFGKSLTRLNLAPNLTNLTSVVPIFNETLKPNYEDFFQALFSWLTCGDSPVNRAAFVSWWRNPVGEPPESVRNPYAVKIDSVRVRRSFKEKVTAFLEQLRNPQKSSAPPDGSGNPFVDGIHYVKNKLLNVFFRPSNWNYVPGYSVTVGIQTPLKLVSAGGGGGNFTVFNKNEPEKKYPLRFAVASVGTGFGPSSPININVSPEPFSSSGKIYQGLGNSIVGDVSFYGAFVMLGVGAANVVNQTSSLMFIAPNYATPLIAYPGMDSVRWAQIFSSVIPLSSAILSLDSNGLEASIGVSAQLACGFVGPGKL